MSLDSIPPRKLRSSLSIHVDFPATDDDDDDADDNFMMYEFKVRPCGRARSHDWTDCPLAHPGEKARRRDPRRYHYAGTMCADYKAGKGGGACCPRGDACEYAHGVFECWLHPAKYRTTPCRDGKGCERKVCFFAHSRSQLRVIVSSPLPLFLSPTSTLVGPTSKRKGWLVEELMRRLEEMEMETAAAAAAEIGGGPDLEWVEELLLE